MLPFSAMGGCRDYPGAAGSTLAIRASRCVLAPPSTLQPQAACRPARPGMKLSHGQRARNVDGNREQSHRVRKADGARLVCRRRTVRGAVEEIPRRRPRSSHPGGRFTSARQAIRLDTGSTLALAAGMCAVVAMAVQNAVEGVPSTPGMTTNISRFVLALGDLIARGSKLDRFLTQAGDAAPGSHRRLRARLRRRRGGASEARTMGLYLSAALALVALGASFDCKRRQQVAAVRRTWRIWAVARGKAEAVRWHRANGRRPVTFQSRAFFVFCARRVELQARSMSACGLKAPAGYRRR